VHRRTACPRAQLGRLSRTLVRRAGEAVKKEKARYRCPQEVNLKLALGTVCHGAQSRVCCPSACVETSRYWDGYGK